MKDMKDALKEAENKFYNYKDKSDTLNDSSNKFKSDNFNESENNYTNKVIFGSYDDLDEMLLKYNSCDIYTIEKPPRKISRRLMNAPFIEMIALPPYVASANKLLLQSSNDNLFDKLINGISDSSRNDSELQQKLLFTLGYFTSLSTVDFCKLVQTVNNKIIISSERNDEYGVRSILGAVLVKLGCTIYYYDSGNLSNVSFDSQYKSWSDECINLTFGKLKLIFPKIDINNSLETIMDSMGLLKFRMDNSVLIEQVNNGHYIPRVFNEQVEDINLPLADKLGRLLISRQAISSRYVQTVIEVSAELIKTLYN